MKPGKVDATTVLEEELKKISYPSKYVQASWGGTVPCGIKGQDLWPWFERLQKIYQSKGFDQR